MKALINKIKAFLVDEQGAETVEWVVIVALLVMVIIAIYNNILMTTLTDTVNSISTNIRGATSQ
jgi:Flp pilus assembly pilin Flp